MTASGTQEMWTVYWSPTDFPGEYVARKFVVTAGEFLATLEHVRAPTLRQVRDQLPAIGMTCLGRERGDDPVIVETWV